MVHDFAIFSRISDLQLLMAIFSANMPQIACWGKTNEHDGYKTSFTSDDIRLDDLPGSSNIPVHFENNAAALVCDRKIKFVKMGRTVRFRKVHLDRFILKVFKRKDSRP